MLEIDNLKQIYKNTFNKLNIDEEKTLEFYYKMGKVRGVDAYLYIDEAIQRASMKQDLQKPICYIAGLLKSFYKNGLYYQPCNEELDLFKYIESKIGNLNDNNKNILRKIISSVGTTKLMAAASETLNNSKIQDIVIDEILLKLVDIWDINKDYIQENLK